jgi:hypothetical protein
MKKNILVIYYSQTGQLTNVIKNLLSPISSSESIEVHYSEIIPIKPYPFPWSSKEFFDLFPECVLEIGTPIVPLVYDETIHFDLIVLAYQPWYLSPSQPMTSFLQSEQATELLKGKEVVTIIGARNMWLQGQEKIKRKLVDLEAKLVGNIVLYDKAFNLVSVYTVLRWLLYGKKGNSGISEKDIKDSSKFGTYIANCILKNEPINQKELLNLGAVKVIPNLADLEKTATKLFYWFAKFVRAKGEPGDPNRRFRVRLFGFYLLLGIVILSPLTTFIYYLTSALRMNKIKKDIAYFKGVDLN